MRIIIFLFTISLNTVGYAQEQMEVEGRIKISDSELAPQEGTIRYNHRTKNFEGYNGNRWLSFTSYNSYDIDIEVVKELNHTSHSAIGVDIYCDDTTNLIAYYLTDGNSQPNDSIIVYDVYNDREILKINQPTDAYYSNSIRFDKFGTGLYYVSNRKLKYLSNYNTTPTIVGNLGSVRSLEVDEERSKIAIIEYFNSQSYLTVLNLSSTGTVGPVERRVAINTSYLEGDLEVSLNFRHIAIGGGYENNKVLVHDYYENSTLETNTINTSGAYSPNFFNDDGGIKLAIGGGYNNGDVTIIDPLTGSLINNFEAFNNYNYYLESSENNTLFVAGGYNGTLNLYDWGDFQIKGSIQLNLINSLAISKNSRYVAVAQGGWGTNVILPRIVLLKVNYIPILQRGR